MTMADHPSRFRLLPRYGGRTDRFARRPALVPDATAATPSDVARTLRTRGILPSPGPPPMSVVSSRSDGPAEQKPLELSPSPSQCPAHRQRDDVPKVPDQMSGFDGHHHNEIPDVPTASNLEQAAHEAPHRKNADHDHGSPPTGEFKGSQPYRPQWPVRADSLVAWVRFDPFLSRSENESCADLSRTTQLLRTLPNTSSLLAPRKVCVRRGTLMTRLILDCMLAQADPLIVRVNCRMEGTPDTRRLSSGQSLIIIP